MAAKRFFFFAYFLGIFLLSLFLPFLLVIFLTGTFQVAQPNRPNSCPCRFHDCNKFFFHYLLHCDFFSVRLFHWTLLGLGTFPLLHLSLLSDPFRLTNLFQKLQQYNVDTVPSMHTSCCSMFTSHSIS